MLPLLAVLLMPVGPAAAQQAPARASIADLDMSAVPQIGKAGVAIVQTLLRQRETSPGKIDGIYGPKTIAAIRAFQSRYGMPPSGKIDNQLLFALGRPDLAR